MSPRIRTLVVGSSGLLAVVALAMIPSWSFHREVPAAAIPQTPIDRRIDPMDVAVRDQKRHDKKAPADRRADPSDVSAPERTGSATPAPAPAADAPARRESQTPADRLPRFDREPATEAAAPSLPRQATGSGVVLASVSDPSMRMRIAPPETSSLSASPAASEPATPVSPATSSSSRASAAAAATPVPTPSFCPVGSSMKQAKGTYGREKWCVKGDRAGIDIKDGPYVAFWSDGKKRAEGTWMGGKQAGEWIEWYSNGKLAAQGEYRNGRRDGRWTFYRESGKKAEEGPFRNGEKEGHWVVFDDAGRRLAEGEIRSEEKVARENGKWTWFWPNGTKKEEGTFQSGKRDGRWTSWDARGRVVSVNDYRDGEKE